MSVIKQSYLGKDVLITGGTGFLGRNLAAALKNLGASVTLSDVVENGSAIGLFKEGFQYEQADITDAVRMRNLVAGRHYIFDLAGLSGVAVSNEHPLEHMAVNCVGHLTVLEACRTANPEVSIHFPSSQLVYGKAAVIPVSEDAPTNPMCVYGIQKLEMEHYYRLYYELYSLKTSCLRISNPYGPGQQGEQGHGVVNNFIIRALKDEPITVFGDGGNIRDFVYVDDVISAMLTSAASPAAHGRVFNCGGPKQVSLLSLAELIVQEAGRGRVEMVDWPDALGRADVGHIFLDKTLIYDKLGWMPHTGIEEGIKKTVDYYV